VQLVSHIRIQAAILRKFGRLQGAAFDTILVYAPIAGTRQAAKLAENFPAPNAQNTAARHIGRHWLENITEIRAH